MRVNVLKLAHVVTSAERSNERLSGSLSLWDSSGLGQFRSKNHAKPQWWALSSMFAGVSFRDQRPQKDIAGILTSKGKGEEYPCSKTEKENYSSFASFFLCPLMLPHALPSITEAIYFSLSIASHITTVSGHILASAFGSNAVPTLSAFCTMFKLTLECAWSCLHNPNFLLFSYEQLVRDKVLREQTCDAELHLSI